MKKLMIITICIIFANTQAQDAPKNGKKILEVKESYPGEYIEEIIPGELDEVLVGRMKTNVIKKSVKYGFDNITVLDVGQVYYPSGEEVTSDLDWKFQANIIDNNSGDFYKIRISLLGHSPKYIIKEVNEDFYCNNITKSIDKFENSETYNSPYSPITFFKIIKSQQEKSYFMMIKTEGTTASVLKKNVIILFEDGSKITRPEVKVDVEVGGSKSYIYSSTFKLTENEVKKLVKDKITDVRLYIYDRAIINGETLRNYMQCLYN
jgi:hypothetical protein